MKLASVLLTLALGAVALAQERIAVLQPSTAVVVMGSEHSTNSVQEPAKRVIPKLIREAKDKLKWRGVEFVPYKEAVSAQNAVLGEMAQDAPATRVRDLDRIATQLNARYVVASVVRELTSYRAEGWAVKRKAGRATIHVIVYDAQAKRYVWEDDRTESSIREQWFDGESLTAMQEQALFNAYRKCLDPFLLHGRRKEIATPTMKLVAKVVSVAKDGKTVVLDLGSASGLAVGDVLTSIDGGASLRVTEILENGAIAEVVEGTPEKDGVFRSGAAPATSPVG